MKIWTDMSERYSNISRREKVLIAVLGWAAIIFVGGLYLLEPAWIKLGKTEAALSSAKLQQPLKKQQIELLNLQLQQDPNIELQRKVAELRAVERSLDDALQDKVSELVTPQFMAQIIESALSKTSKVTMRSLRSMPAKKLQLHEGERFYIHPMELVIEGGYSDIHSYLVELEALPVVFYWQSFAYQVEKHPLAQVKLVIFTIGPREEFISG